MGRYFTKVDGEAGFFNLLVSYTCFNNLPIKCSLSITINEMYSWLLFKSTVFNLTNLKPSIDFLVMVFICCVSKYSVEFWETNRVFQVSPSSRSWSLVKLCLQPVAQVKQEDAPTSDTTPVAVPEEQPLTVNERYHIKYRALKKTCKEMIYVSRNYKRSLLAGTVVRCTPAQWLSYWTAYLLGMYCTELYSALEFSAHSDEFEKRPRDRENR